MATKIEFDEALFIDLEDREATLNSLYTNFFDQSLDTIESYVKSTLEFLLDYLKEFKLSDEDYQKFKEFINSLENDIIANGL